MGKFYLNLIKASRVSLVSTLGCDGGRIDEFGYFDFVTLRFYEGAAMYCHIIGRYTKNEVTHRLGIEYVCPCVTDYNEFVKIMNMYLKERDWNWSEQQLFVNNNFTSSRVYFVLDKITNDI